MTGTMSTQVLDTSGIVVTYVIETVRHALLWPAAAFSLHSLLAALLIASGFLLLRRRRPLTILRIRALIRALFPRRWLFGRSSQADFMMFLLNTFVFALILGQAILSAKVVAAAATTTLVGALGTMPETQLPWLATALLFTLAMFLAYEFGYWLDHYLAHKIPLLWEFHKVHHSAEVLTPLTNARVHPVDSLVFLNILALVMGLTHGVLSWAFARQIDQITIAGSNALLVAFTYLVAHLQHSHVWIAFTGTMGKILLSPAHHQIHHSSLEAHHDRNFGACLSIWDWMFGTLVLPEARRQKLTFGVEQPADNPHSLTGTIITPFVCAARRLAASAPVAAAPWRSTATH